MRPLTGRKGAQMPHRTHIAHRIVRTVRRWLPGPEAIAGGAAATGNPSPLLGLEAGPHRHTDPAGTK
jgi:hypothetical protein